MCGIFAGKGISWEQFQLGFSALQHRGQDAAGWLHNAGREVIVERQVGEIASLTSAQFPETVNLNSIYLGHNRYATTGPQSQDNIQPFLGKNAQFQLGLIHNGNLLPQCVTFLKSKVREQYVIGTSDSAYLTNYLLSQRPNYVSWQETLSACLSQVEGAFSLLMTTEENELLAARDPWGIRPLVLGQDRYKNWIIASETRALDAADAQFVREVEPGEVVKISAQGKLSRQLYTGKKKLTQRFCLLEILYFSDESSMYENYSMAHARQRLGQAVAQRFSKKNIAIDKVVPILGGGKHFAQGAALFLHKPLQEAIKKNGNKRSFIGNSASARETIVHRKHIPISDQLVGQKVLLVDDSIVRGTSLKILLDRIREVVAAAKPTAPMELHLLIGSPPVVGTCDLGVDLATEEEVLASRWRERPLEQIEEEMAHFFDVDSITFATPLLIKDALMSKNKKLCYHCFGGPHPILSN